MQLEYLDDAKEELKRVDHLIFVSLKYTRTVDVIISIIERILNCYEFIIDGLLQEAVDNNKLDTIPKTPVVKTELLLKFYGKDPVFKPYMDFYLLLRKVVRAKYERAREFRRHVTMTALVDEKEMEVNIDIISDYFKRMKEFVAHIEDNYLKSR
tara:strand:+ start:250 stop:711 length:462 start_codon:yes stop_codon:yes gene_type:complete